MNTDNGRKPIEDHFKSTVQDMYVCLLPDSPQAQKITSLYTSVGEEIIAQLRTEIIFFF